MGISERREREKNERRKAILDCAKELILSRGVEHVSMEDIAHKAELSKATLYLYFSGKEVLLNEICEESARAFVEHFKPLLESGLTGIRAMRCFWRSYVEMFGSSDEMIIVFKVRNFLNSWLPIVTPEEKSKSPYVDAILDAMKAIIDQCKAEGLFDPNLDSVMATRLLLSVFSLIVEKAAALPPELRRSPAIAEEMTNAFQIIVNGLGREGAARSSLNIMGA